MEKLKIRCSSLGKIMTGVSRSGITEKQTEELQMLLDKIKLTEKQALRRDELIRKRDEKPTLSAGAKTEVEKLVKAEYLNYKGAQMFSSKETEKGNLCEEEAISIVSEFYFVPFEKNEMHFMNDYIMGTPDIIKDKKIRDTKCPWSKATMPLTNKDAYNADYEWQMRGYMWLTNSDEAFVHYVLVNTPEHLVRGEDLLLHKMDDLPLEKRVFTIKFNRDSLLEEMMINQIELCREYAKEYLEVITNDFKYI